MNLLSFRTFQYIIVKNTKCALCKETKTENFRTMETTKGKAEEGRCNKVVILVLHIYLYIYFLLLDK